MEIGIPTLTMHRALPHSEGPSPSVSKTSNPLSPSIGSDPLSPSKASTQAPKELDLEQQRQVDELKLRDQEVRAHEAAHMAAAGGLLIRAANFSYQKGPDEKNYAVAGEV